MFGQVDYFAANAFLDAFAHYKTWQDGPFTVSINWDSWQEIGMAAAAAKQWQTRREPIDIIDILHPCSIAASIRTTNRPCL